MRTENRKGEGECYQVNGGIKAVYDDKKEKLLNLEIGGEEVDEERIYTLLIQGYHFKNCKEYLNITCEELESSGKSRTVTTSAQEVIKEYLMSHQNLEKKIEGRLIYQAF
jgi:5'-nucleotidase / UDP-sugar diphosphatase